MRPGLSTSFPLFDRVNRTMYEYTSPSPDDHAAIEALLDQAFGPDRHNKTSYRYREGVDPLPALSMIARDDGRLVGTIAYWPVVIGAAATPALLLGPVAVDPPLRGLGIGVTLIRRTLAQAARDGHRIVVLVGDRDYYERFGFAMAEPHGIVMPRQPDRLMVKALSGDGLDGVSGAILPWTMTAGRKTAAA